MKRLVLPLLLACALLLTGAQVVFSQQGAAEKRGRAAPREMLPEELQGTEVADYFIASEAEEAGVIQTVIGHVVVLHQETNEAYFAAPGDRLYQHDVLITLKQSRCRVKFTTEDLIAMGENTRIGVDEYVDDRAAQKKHSVLSMARGKAMFYMLRLFKYKAASASVSTPTATVGIRGTKFGVEVRKAGEEPLAARPIHLASASNLGFLYLAASDPAGWETIVYVFEGEVNVNGQPVEQGETWEEGVIQPTEPEDAEQFISDTEGGEEGGGEKGEGGEGGKGETGAGETDTTKTGDGGKATDQSQNQTSIDAEDQGKDQGLIGPTTTTQPQGATTQPQGAKYGYFSAMLSGNSTCWKGSYISKTRQTFASDGTAIEGWDDSHYMKGVAATGTNEISYVTRVTSSDGDSGELGTSVPVDHHEIGSNAYMEWGYWTTPNNFKINDNTSQVDNWAYYIFGDPTPDDKISDLASASTEATYSGNAYGTYWTSGGGTNMSGTFGAHVAFSSGTIDSFDLSVSGSSGSGDEATYVSAEISGASGTLSGNHFTISPSSGTWKINSNPAIEKAAYGSFYGPNAESMGGVWKMGVTAGGSGEHAVGIFHGNAP